METSPTFPAVVCSTLSAASLVTSVVSRYPIGEVQSCQFWTRGLSDIYMVTADTGNYVLRVSHAHWRSHNEIAFELAFMDFLRDRQLPIAHPLRTHDGHLCIELPAPEGKRYASLFVYAPGKIPLGDLNKAQAYTLGEILGQIHAAATAFQPPVARPDLDLSYVLDGSIATIQPFLTHRPDFWTELQTLTERTRSQLTHLPRTAPHWTVCWGDPHSGNAHFTTDQQATLFDFDQCGYGWRAFDLAKFLQVSIRTGISRSVRDQFFAGYEAVQPLEAWEWEALAALTAMAHCWSWSISIAAIQQHSYSRLDDGYFNYRLQQLKMLHTPEWQLF